MRRRDEKPEIPRTALINLIAEMNDACNTLITNIDSLRRNGVIKQGDYMYYIGCISDLDVLISDVEETLPKKQPPQPIPQIQQSNICVTNT